jgi:hypothetical protein
MTPLLKINLKTRTENFAIMHIYIYIYIYITFKSLWNKNLSSFHFKSKQLNQKTKK